VSLCDRSVAEPAPDMHVVWTQAMETARVKAEQRAAAPPLKSQPYTEARQLVYACIAGHANLTSTQVVALTGLPSNTVYVAIRSLCVAGYLAHTGEARSKFNPIRWSAK
jgi:hypothetical protein